MKVKCNDNLKRRSLFGLQYFVILFVGPLPETQAGMKYVLTLTDYFTKYVEFLPLTQKSGLCVARALKTYIYRYDYYCMFKFISAGYTLFPDKLNL